MNKGKQGGKGLQFNTKGKVKPEPEPEQTSAPTSRGESLRELYVPAAVHAAMKRYCAQQDPPEKMIHVVSDVLRRYLATKGYMLDE